MKKKRNHANEICGPMFVQNKLIHSDTYNLLIYQRSGVLEYRIIQKLHAMQKSRIYTLIQSSSLSSYHVLNQCTTNQLWIRLI